MKTITLNTLENLETRALLAGADSGLLEEVAVENVEVVSTDVGGIDTTTEEVINNLDETVEYKKSGGAGSIIEVTLDTIDFVQKHQKDVETLWNLAKDTYNKICVLKTGTSGDGAAKDCKIDTAISLFTPAIETVTNSKLIQELAEKASPAEKEVLNSVEALLSNNAKLLKGDTDTYIKKVIALMEKGEYSDKIPDEFEAIAAKYLASTSRTQQHVFAILDQTLTGESSQHVRNIYQHFSAAYKGVKETAKVKYTDAKAKVKSFFAKVKDVFDGDNEPSVTPSLEPSLAPTPAPQADREL